MTHPELIRPERHAAFNPERMGKSTIFMSDRMMVGLNDFEPGQEHALHAHENQDKVRHVYRMIGERMPYGNYER